MLCAKHTLFYSYPFFFIVLFRMGAHSTQGLFLCTPNGTMTNTNQHHLINSDLDTPDLVEPANQNLGPALLSYQSLSSHECFDTSEWSRGWRMERDKLGTERETSASVFFLRPRS